MPMTRCGQHLRGTAQVVNPLPRFPEEGPEPLDTDPAGLLPEDRRGFSLDETAFDVRGKLPRVPSNVRLHPGWFDRSLPEWLKQNEGPVAFMHMDCDLYSSTKTIFDLLAARLQPGTIVLSMPST
jgi:hypothetical protein